MSQSRRNSSGLPSIGVVLPPVPALSQLWDAVQTIDAGGFESVWVTDRTVANGPWLDSLSMLAALAARTTRCRIGTSVLAIARRNPVYTAHALATVDYLSGGGRLIAGVGLGGLEPREYELAGVDMRFRAQITDDYIDLLRKLWRETDVSHSAPAYSCDRITLAPRPPTTIPIWIGGNSPGALRRAGALGDGWISVFCGPVEFKKCWSDVRAAALDVGRDPDEIKAAAYVFGAVSRSPGHAESVLDPAMRSLFGAPLEAMAHSCVFGTPQQWLDTLAEFADAGASSVNVLLFSDELSSDVDILAAEVASAT